MYCFFLLVCYLSSVASAELLSRHRRFWIIDSFTIEEEHPGPFPYMLGNINVERDYRIYFDLFGQGVDEEPKGVLSIDKESGNVSVHKAVDYEKYEKLKLKFEARKADLSTDTNLGVEIPILDINDNPPRFQKDLYETNIKEETTQGSHLVMVVAYDRDQPETPNSTFHYEIKSVSPKPPDVEFFIDESGRISFRGCLDYEVADMFTVLVEAKDHGDVVSLSSSTTVVIKVEDGNNHLPTITRQTGSGKVKENEVGISPLRLHVTDKDTPNSTAWIARYTIQGDEGKHFKIETDPDTNDGVLTIVKPLDFEDGAQRELSISVENELPYFSCKVKEKTSSGLWKVDTSKGDDPTGVQPHSVKVLIEVENANDPPEFSVSVKDAMVEENAPVGTFVEKVTAVDPDSSHARDFLYKVGHDPAGWVTVDPHTGNVTTVKVPDRESPHVVRGVYTILLHAVDDDNPPKTGTATLNIHVTDQNDNVPKLTDDTVDVCLSDGPTTTNITAIDLDESPFGGPFTFELLGNVKGKWKLDPSQGYTVGLVKEHSLFAGPHTISVKISGFQGEFAVYNLSVMVCNCSVSPSCRSPRQTAAKAAFGAIGIVCASLFLLPLALLMVVIITCKKEFISLNSSDFSGETLLASHIEKPGTDCELPYSVLAGSADNKHQNTSNWQSVRGMQQTKASSNLPDGVRAVSANNKHKSTSNWQSQSVRDMHQRKASTKKMEPNVTYKNLGDYRGDNVSFLFSDSNQTTWNSLVANSHNQTHQIEDMGTMNSPPRWNSSYTDAALLALLHQNLSSVQEREADLLVYQPHLYEDEDSDDRSELENITIPDDDSFQKALQDLGPKFNELASICKPPHTQN